jgi:hypothetical protein
MRMRIRALKFGTNESHEPSTGTRYAAYRPANTQYGPHPSLKQPRETRIRRLVPERENGVENGDNENKDDAGKDEGHTTIGMQEDRNQEAEDSRPTDTAKSSYPSNKDETKTREESKAVAEGNIDKLPSSSNAIREDGKGLIDRFIRLIDSSLSPPDAFGFRFS